MFNGKKPALAARALKKIAISFGVHTPKQPSRQGLRRSRVTDARYVEPDADWYSDNPNRTHRLRALLPDDSADAPAAACGC